MDKLMESNNPYDIIYQCGIWGDTSIFDNVELIDSLTD